MKIGDGFRTGQTVSVTVTDTGIGVGPEHLKRIFDEFYRVRSDRTAGISGTGLGLSMVRTLVEEYQGRIWAESEPGKGSIFTVELPAAGTRGN